MDIYYKPQLLNFKSMIEQSQYNSIHALPRLNMSGLDVFQQMFKNMSNINVSNLDIDESNQFKTRFPARLESNKYVGCMINYLECNDKSVKIF